MSENNTTEFARDDIFETYKDTLPKEPSGDIKKEYWVGCFQKSDWEFIHAELMKDGSLEDNIPTDKCDCINDCLHSDIRGVYLLTETEASELRANPKVDYVAIKTSSYPGTYKVDPREYAYGPVYRYASTTKNKQYVFGGGTNQESITYLPADLPLLNRCSSQLYRATAKKNPWVTAYGDPNTGPEGTVFNSRIDQYGTGAIDVDVIVCDTAAWLGHIEFCNPSGITDIRSFDQSDPNQVGGSSSTVAPSNYIGGNVLKNGFSSSSTTGIGDVLDLVLDSPYYLDPAWFEADPSNRLTLRWDGTKVPVESVAKEWWSDSTKRSSAYASVGVVPIPTNYTRYNCNGSNTQRIPSRSFWGIETHGTRCASQCYGRQYGWAYNANKWYLNLFGVDGMGLSDGDGMDVQKIFHQVKPNRASDNTKNPTISSNSWGRRFSSYQIGSSGYYYFRPSTIDGTTSGTQYTSWSVNGNTDGTGGTAPRFMTNRWATGYQIQCEPVSGPPVTGLNELVAAGVIFVVASGNHNQKQVKSDHPDYKNYVSTNNNTALADSTFFFSYDQITYRKTLNRGGFPNALSVYAGTNGIINVGALDDRLEIVGSNGRERKVGYSASGNYIDCYATADDSLASTSTDNVITRYDSFYTYNGSRSTLSGDSFMNGTSSACPITAGLIAVMVGHNRTWTTTDIKTWLTTTVGQQPYTDMWLGTESGTANDVGWEDKNSLQGGPPIVIWNTPISTDTTNPTLSTSVPANGATGVSINITEILLNFSEIVTVQTGTVRLYDATAGDTLYGTYNVNDSNDVTGGGTSQITLHVNGSLQYNHNYYIQIDATAFDDASGNSFAGISDKTTLTFSTTPDPTPPPTPDKLVVSGNLSLSGILL